MALEQRTWEEVRNLSINFFIISPALHLPLSPAVHPMFGGGFNLLLAWAVLFTGFLLDECAENPNLLPFGQMLIGMQFLTSGSLLPYLFTRTSERSTEDSGLMMTTTTTTRTTTSSLVAYREDVSGTLQRKVSEWRPLGLALGGVGMASILWGLYTPPEFGNFWSQVHKLPGVVTH